MRFDLEKAFPYPVLRPGTDDYMDAEFQIGVTVTGIGDKVQLDFMAAISSDEIRREIEAGNAQFMCVVSCRNTYFSAQVSSVDKSFSATLQATDLHGPVIVDKDVVATKTIVNFTSEDFNPEFQGGAFDLEINDVLAQDSPEKFFIDRSAMKPLESVVDLIAKPDMEKGRWSIDTESNHLQIHLNPEDKNVLVNALQVKANRPVLLNSIFVSAVNSAITEMQGQSGETEGYDWQVAMTAKLEELGIDLKKSDSLDITQRLLESPLNSLIASFQVDEL